MNWKLTAALSVMSLGACGGGGQGITAPPPPPPPPPPAVDRVALDSSTASLVPGQAVQLRATAFSAAGDSLPNRLATWTSSAATVATVNTTGRVLGVAEGSALVTVTIEGKAATAAIAVRDGGIVAGSGVSVITAAGGNLRLEVPAGAAPAGLVISVATDTTPPAAFPDSIWRAGTTFYGLGPDGTQFTAPVKVTMAYDTTSFAPWMLPQNVRIQRWNGSAWNALSDITVDTVNRTISGTTMGFSTFGFAANLPTLGLTPAKGQVNKNKRFVDFQAAVPMIFAAPPSAYQYRWVTTGSNGSLITGVGHANTTQYLTTSPVIPDGTIDMVGVELSLQQTRGGPFIPIAQASAAVDSDLGLTYELNPWSQQVKFNDTSFVEAIVRERDGSEYVSNDLFYEYTDTKNAGDITPAAGARTQVKDLRYSTWPARQQVKNPPRGEKVSVRFLIRTYVHNGSAFNPSVTTVFTDLGTADAFFEIGKDTYVGRVQVVTVPSGSGGCVSANVYVPKVAPAPSLYTMTVTGINDPTLGTSWTTSWSAPTGGGPLQVADAGGEYRVTLASGCAQSASAVAFRENLYNTNFGGAQVESLIVP